MIGHVISDTEIYELNQTMIEVIHSLKLASVALQTYFRSPLRLLTSDKQISLNVLLNL